jgi:hypothetical protein
MKTLKKQSSKTAIMVSMGLFAFLFFALVTVAWPQESLPLEDAISQIVELYIQHKGSALGITFVVVQGLMLLLKTSLQSIAGKYKLVLVAALTTAGAIISNLMEGGSIGAIIGDSVVWTSLMVFINQLIKQPKQAYIFQQ